MYLYLFLTVIASSKIVCCEDFGWLNNKQHSLEKLRKGRYEKLFIHSQVDQSLIDKLQCYLPDIEQKNINFVTLFNNGTVFTSKVPHHIDIIETFIFKLKQNAGVLSMHDLIVPIGMLVSRMDKIESAEDEWMSFIPMIQ